MDEIELLRRFRAEAPLSEPIARENVRARLEAVMATLAAAEGRSGRQSLQGLRRTWVAVAALVVAAVAATSAFAWGDRLLDFVTGEAAPPSVQRNFALQNDARAKALPIFRSSYGPEIIAERTHGVLGIESSVGPIILWAAPTRAGGVCYLLDIAASRLPDGRPNGGGGCNPTPMSDAVKLQHGFGRTRIGEDYLTLVHGQVTPDVAAVELHYADGKTEQLPLSEGFFLHEPREDVEPTLIVARDGAGRELKRRQIRPQLPQAPQIPKPIGRDRVLFRFTTASGHPLTFSVAPGRDNTICQTSRYRGGIAGGCGPDQRERVRPDEISVHPGLWNESDDRKALITLKGVVGANVAKLELRYEDGQVVKLPLVERFVLFEIPPAHHRDEHFVLVARDRAGEVIARRTVG